jgi:hypothetical protein
MTTASKKSTSPRRKTLTLHKKTASGKILLNGSQSLEGKKVPTSSKQTKPSTQVLVSAATKRTLAVSPFPYSGQYSQQFQSLMGRIQEITPNQVAGLAWASLFDDSHRYEGATALASLNSKNQIVLTNPLEIEMTPERKDLHAYIKKVIHLRCSSFEAHNLRKAKVLTTASSLRDSSIRYLDPPRAQEKLNIDISPADAETLAARVTFQTALAIIEQDDLRDSEFKQYVRAWESVMGYAQQLPRRDERGFVGKKNYYGSQDAQVQYILNQVHLITTDQAKALALILLKEERGLANHIQPALWGKATKGFSIHEKLRSRTWPEWSTGSRPNADTLQSDLDLEARSITWNPALSIDEKEAVRLYLRTLTIAVSMSDTLFIKPLAFAAKDISVFTQPWESVMGSLRAESSSGKVREMPEPQRMGGGQE